MLQFWKSGHKKNGSPSPKSPTGNVPTSNQSALYCNLAASTSNKAGPLATFDDEGLFDIGECEPKSRSRLSKTLQEVLADKNALSYFIQFMEFKNASSYILCWLDIDAFKSDIISDSSKTLDRTYSPLASSRIDHDSLSVSTDCDSYTADSNSICDCSTATLAEAKVELNGLCDNSDNNSNIKKTDERIVDHALSIFKKYIALEAVANVRCTEELRKEVMENICVMEKVLSGHCFDPVQTFLYTTMENEYFSIFLGSDFFCKLQIEVLTSGNVVLEDILYNETALFYFMEYLEQEGQRNLLDFWIATTNFQQQLKDQQEFYDPQEAQNDAVVLYDKYFSLQAHCPLGFSDKVRFAVEQSICGEKGLILDCFHLPLKIVEQVIEKNYLQPFLASQLFYKYLSELINTVHYNGYSSLSTDGKYSPSDCSSEKSFSTSTFLALEIPQNVKKKEKKTDMSIDTRELYDPDALWKRKKCHRLSLGRVTELGKYITYFEPEPDKKEFRLKEVVKKIVSHDEEERKKEEMAWQVAEMIVKDITSVTLNDEKP